LTSRIGSKRFGAFEVKEMLFDMMKQVSCRFDGTTFPFISGANSEVEAHAWKRLGPSVIHGAFPVSLAMTCRKSFSSLMALRSHV
jgi:hypothetical protein